MHTMHAQMGFQISAKKEKTVLIIFLHKWIPQSKLEAPLKVSSEYVPLAYITP